MKTLQLLCRWSPVFLCLALVFASGCRTRETARPTGNAVFGSRDILPPPFSSPEEARPRSSAEPPLIAQPGSGEPILPVSVAVADPFVAPTSSFTPPSTPPGIDSLLVPATGDTAAPVSPPSTSKPAAVRSTPAPVSLPPATSQRTYVVQSGDSLSLIAHRYGINWPTLAALNGMDGKTVLQPGMVLLLPDNALATPKTRTVASTPKSTAAGKPAAAAATRGTATTATSKIAREQRPADGVYKVRPNDSLWVIARRFGCTTNELRALNNLTSDTLRVGQELKIPAVNADQAGALEAKATAQPAAAGTAPTPPKVVLEGQRAAGQDAVAVPPVVITPPVNVPPVNINPGAGILQQAPVPIPNTPPNVAPAAVAEAPKQMTHTLSPEETLQDLAEMYNVSIPEILRLNPGVNNDADLKKRTQVIIPLQAK